MAGNLRFQSLIQTSCPIGMTGRKAVNTMAKQKKIIDIHADGTHMICTQSDDRRDPNPYRIYLVISPTGVPLRKRLLTKYGDFISVLCFFRDFYVAGMDTMCYTDIVQWIRSGTVH